MNIDLPVIFTVLMGAALLAYVVLDGYDLGVGMLMPAATTQEQAIMVTSIGPFWDANETWLVLGVGLLLVAFPSAHGYILGELYLPAVAMLIGLMLRGVAFELRIKAEGWHAQLWNMLFWFGSFLASFSQGFMLGRYVVGFEWGLGYFFFSVLVGGAVCGGYVLLGATWLIARTEGALQQKACSWARWGLFWVALGVALVSLATPLASATVRAKWFDLPHTLWLMILPVTSAFTWFWVWREVGRVKENHTLWQWGPFAGAALIFVLAFLGLAYSIYPFIVIDKITLWQAAAHTSALKFVLAGALVVLPFIIAYTLVVYRIFRGKTRAH